MRKLLVLICLIVVIPLSCLADSHEYFPFREIQGIRPVDLWPEKYLSFSKFVTDEKNWLERDSDKWSSLYPEKNLNLTLLTHSSSNLGKAYESATICDGKIETAWVEGVEGNGIGEWVKIAVDAYTCLSEITTTPFEVSTLAVIPGYGKSSKTWTENNRVRKLLVVINTPPQAIPKENEWVVLRLNLKDENSFQVFGIPVQQTAVNMDPMKRNVWIKIEEIYKGTKYQDTCISEFVLAGGFSN